MEESNLGDGSIISMEVDLRSIDRIKHTLHFFFNNVQQKVYVAGLPMALKYMVYLILIYLLCCNCLNLCLLYTVNYICIFDI